ncbi:transglycosylase SLT domain-containing protein, partial [Streptomyces sp. DSM 42041]
INSWDINAINGIPSKGLLQVIPPTFKAYHVKGTSSNIYDPVANITAAANYAADKYGSIDNVNSAY